MIKMKGLGRGLDALLTGSDKLHGDEQRKSGQQHKMSSGVISHEPNRPQAGVNGAKDARRFRQTPVSPASRRRP